MSGPGHFWRKRHWVCSFSGLSSGCTGLDLLLGTTGNGISFSGGFRSGLRRQGMSWLRWRVASRRRHGCTLPCQSDWCAWWLVVGSRHCSCLLLLLVRASSWNHLPKLSDAHCVSASSTLLKNRAVKQRSRISHVLLKVELLVHVLLKVEFS